MAEPVLETERLVLRPPLPDDLAWQMAWLNTAAVMRFLGGVRPREAFETGFERNLTEMAQGEPGFWTVVERASGAPLGKCGLARVAGGAEPPALQGGIQVGWSLAEPFWGKGFASEAARAAIAYGFERFEAQQIWSQTSDSNIASTRLMARLGLSRCPALDYVDPDYPPEDNPTTVYQLTRAQWDFAA